jgi:hypothetical protein
VEKEIIIKTKVKMDYRNLSPVLAELLVLQFEQVCTLPVHNSDRATQKSVQLMHAQSQHKLQQIRTLGTTQKQQLIKRLKEALVSFNSQCKSFRASVSDEQRESLKTMQSTLLKGSIPSSLDWTTKSHTAEDVKTKFSSDFEEMRKYYKKLTGNSFRGKNIDTLAERIANAS